MIYEPGILRGDGYPPVAGASRKQTQSGVTAAHGQRAGVLGNQLPSSAQNQFGGKGLGHQRDMGKGRWQAFTTIAGKEDEGGRRLGQARGDLLDRAVWPPAQRGRWAMPAPS
mgnify:CR=1 FL=1